MARLTIRRPQLEDLEARWVSGNEEWGFYDRPGTLADSAPTQAIAEPQVQTQWYPVVTFLRSEDGISIVFHRSGG